MPPIAWHTPFWRPWAIRTASSPSACHATPDRIVAALGVLKAGLAYVPIDPALHDAGRRDLAIHADALCILTDQALRNDFGPSQRTIDIGAITTTGPNGNPGIHPGLDANAYLRYTSGSTGSPKGVLHNHRAALGQALAFVETVDLRADDRLCCLSFFPHVLILGTLAIGAALHIVDPTRDGLRQIGASLRRGRVSMLSCFPSMLRSLSPALLADGGVPDMRTISFSGEPVTADDMNLARRCMPTGGIAINNYGSSEFVQIASYPMTTDMPPGASVPVGKAPSGVELRLIDADGQIVPPGGVGEITIRAAFMSSGYWKRPDLTRAVFGGDTPQDGKTAYRTGDIGRMASDGVVTVLGRVDNQIKIRAFRITPEEIEAVLSTHPAVAAVAVRPYTDAHGTSLLAAFIVPEQGKVMDVAGLRAHARAHLPPHMVPTAFIALAALPQTTGGKLDRAALADPLPLWRDNIVS